MNGKKASRTSCQTSCRSARGKVKGEAMVSWRRATNGTSLPIIVDPSPPRHTHTSPVPCRDPAPRRDDAYGKNHTRERRGGARTVGGGGSRAKRNWTGLGRRNGRNGAAVLVRWAIQYGWQRLQPPGSDDALFVQVGHRVDRFEDGLGLKHAENHEAERTQRLKRDLERQPVKLAPLGLEPFSIWKRLSVGINKMY